MTRDDNKSIASITYNHLNLPKQILFSGIPNRKINYLYNALGQKVEKKITNNLTETVTNYQGMFHYENNILKFFATAEGYVNVTTGGRQCPDGPSYIFSYIYNYTDHLGNIRVSYTNNGINAAIIEENHYYPFGLKHKKYGMADPVPKLTYQYKYNGKEFQDELELNWTSMDYRNYDNALGRFHSIDRLAELAPSITPYRFAFNNPVYWKDPTGLFETYELAEEHIKNNKLDGAFIFNNSNGTFSINHQHKGTDYVLTMIDGELDISGVMESIEITNSQPSKSSQSKGYFESYFKDYFSYKRPAHANAYSPYIPTNRDIAGGLQSVGNGLAYAGYTLTLTGIFAEVGVPLAAIGNGMSTVGFAFDIYLDWEEGNTELAKFKAGAFAVNYFANRIGVRTAGKTTFKGASKADEKLGKKQMETVIEAQINFYTDKIIENQQNGNK